MNVPLRDGADDQTYDSLFKNIMTNIMNRFQPEAIVFQSGKDFHSLVWFKRTTENRRTKLSFFCSHHCSLGLKLGAPQDPMPGSNSVSQCMCIHHLVI